MAAYPRKIKPPTKKRTILSQKRKMNFAPTINSSKNIARRHLVSLIAKYIRIQKTNPEIANERITQLREELSLLEKGEIQLQRYTVLLKWAKEQKEQQAKRVELKKANRAMKKSTQVI